MMNIVILFANYGPYHLARISAFSEICKQRSWTVTGIEIARAQSEYPWKASIKNLDIDIISLINNKKVEEASFWEIFKKLRQKLSSINPNVIAISGYFRPIMIAALLWSINNNKSAILFSESKEDDTNRSQWREVIKSIIIKKYATALVGGKPHKRYLKKLGMPSAAIFYGYDVVDNQVFNPSCISQLPKPDVSKNYFLAINRFVPKKNLLYLIKAYADYRHLARDNSWGLVLCGDGNLRVQIEQLIQSLNLENYIHLPGFLQQEQLLPYFAHASCFIHASIQEQWGLVVNEAMAAGLPVLVSNRCGCFEDLVIEGVNGFGFDPENSQELTNLMHKISSEEINLKLISEAAFKHIEKFSPKYFAQGLEKAIEYQLTNNKQLQLNR